MRTLTYFERQMAIKDCRDACCCTVERTDKEHRDVAKRAAEACRKLGIEYPEDAF